MSMHKKVKEEKIRDVDFTNQLIHRIISYSNILSTKCEFLKDNGITNFAFIEHIDDIKNTNLLDKESFI